MPSCSGSSGDVGVWAILLPMIAIRGAIQVDEDTREAISAAAASLCVAIMGANQLAPADIISAIFTLTPDLHADFPARAAREQGWTDVPMICAQEIGVPGALPRVCRVLLHVDAAGPARHVYLGGAAVLRPDLAAEPR
jgi:chorismate mutase